MTRLAGIIAAVALFVATGCGTVLAPEALYARSIELTTQQPYHLDGKIDLAVKGTSPNASMSMTFGMSMAGDIQPPDRFRGTFGANLFGQSINQEIVTVGGKSWTRQSGGAWVEGKSSQKAPTLNALVDPKYVKSTAEMPQEDIDGRRMRHLVVQFDLDKLGTQDPTGTRSLLTLLGADATSGTASLTLDHWVDVGTNVVRRQKVSMDVSGTKGSFGITVVLDYTHFGEAIQPPIEAPH